MIPFTSDAAFLANAQFTKAFGGNARWGNNAGNGDWEYAVVDVVGGLELPIGTPAQYVWETDPSQTEIHSYVFQYETTSYTASLDINPDRQGLGGVHSGFVGDLETEINALAIRARAADGDVAILYDSIWIQFNDNTSLTLSGLIGDGDAQYYLLVDERLNDGFTVSGTALLEDGRGSVPMYGFKVGYSTVPIPGAALLFVPGLGVLAVVLRKRRSRQLE